MKTLSMLVFLVVVGVSSRLAWAHCDSLDGPVVKSAQKALETGQLGPVLAWVRAEDEAAIKHAFAETQAVRKLGPRAQALADRSFFETLVRLHRAGEGAPYDGLKPAGLPQSGALAAAERAVSSGKADTLTKHLAAATKDGVAERFAELRALPPPGADPAQGRAWVARYVTFIHYVTGIERALAAGHAHGPAAEKAPAAHHHP
jgi:hypothetical protein